MRGTLSGDSAASSGRAIVPMGSMWASGDKVRRPCARGRPSPNRFAIQACADGVNPKAPCVDKKHPNSPAGLDPQWGQLWAAARSYHSGGVNAAFGDGSVRFVRDSISAPVWKAMGTKAGGEVVGNE